MNKILKYIGVLSLLLFVGTSCSDPDNWTIVTETPEGAYVIGDATVYQAAATASYFSPAELILEMVKRLKTLTLLRFILG